MVVKGQWSRTEHINVLEALACLQMVRRASRSSSNWGLRHLMLTDSQVTQGAFCKGRSSSLPLLFACRKLASAVLGLRMRMMFRYVPTDRNPADGPSRGSDRVGVF